MTDTMLVRQLVLRTAPTPDAQTEVLAEFWMDGDRLRSWYATDRVRYSVESDGVAVYDGVFLPSDGRRFFDALPDGMRRCSVLTTRDVERKHPPK